MKLIDLFEKKQWVLDELYKYKDRPNMYVHFTDILKVGINPKTSHKDTPVGIFAYPLDVIFDEMVAKTVPYAGDKKYVYLLESVGKVLDLNNYPEDQFHKDILSMKAFNPYIGRHKDQWDMLLDTYSRNELMSNGLSLWKISRSVSHQLEGRPIYTWNTILRNMGYDAVLDRGKGILNHNEEYQICFLHARAFKTYGVFMNNHTDDYSAVYRYDI